MLYEMVGMVKQIFSSKKHSIHNIAAMAVVAPFSHVPV
jgi:hypothetical protein